MIMITFYMPGHSTSSTVNNIKNHAWKRQSLGAHDGRNGRNSPLKRELYLGFMLVFWGKRHCEDIFLE